MPDPTWIFWSVVACAALVAVAVVLGRYAASLFLDASRTPPKVQPESSEPAE